MIELDISYFVPDSWLINKEIPDYYSRLLKMEKEADS